MTMKPESEWFRPPKVHEICRRGDCRRFLLVAEPERGEGVYGVGYEITEALICSNPSLLDEISGFAMVELHRRIQKHDAHGEGELWEVFEWRPVFVRDESGAMTCPPPK